MLVSLDEIYGLRGRFAIGLVTLNTRSFGRRTSIGQRESRYAVFVHVIFVIPRIATQGVGANQTTVGLLVGHQPVETLLNAGGVACVVEVVMSAGLKRQQRQTRVCHLVSVATVGTLIVLLALRMGPVVETFAGPESVGCLMPCQPIESLGDRRFAYLAAAIVADPIDPVDLRAFFIKPQQPGFDPVVLVQTPHDCLALGRDFDGANVPKVTL